MRTISMLILVCLSLTAVVGDKIVYTQEQLAEYVGEYGQRYVKTHSGKLFIGLGDGLEIEMATTDKMDIFTIPSMNDQTVTFIRDTDGMVKALRKPGRDGKEIEAAKR